MAGKRARAAQFRRATAPLARPGHAHGGCGSRRAPRSCRQGGGNRQPGNRNALLPRALRGGGAEDLARSAGAQRGKRGRCGALAQGRSRQSLPPYQGPRRGCRRRADVAGTSPMSQRHRPPGGESRDCAPLRDRPRWRAKCWRNASREAPMRSAFSTPRARFLAVCPAVLLLASPAAARRPTKGGEEQTECMRIVSRDQALAETLRSEAFRDFSEPVAIRISGLQSVPEDAVWQLVGGRPRAPLSRAEAVALLARFESTGLFSGVALSLEDGPTLDVELTENPRLRAVRLRGLSEFRSEDVLDRLLETPSSWEVEGSRRDTRAAEPAECPAALPPRDLLARAEDGDVSAGILWKGLRGALDRVTRYLRGRGYPLARLEGSLSASGVLHLDVDEGRLSG